MIDSCLVYSNSCELCNVFTVSVFAFTDDNITHITVESEIFWLFIAGVIIHLFM